MNDRDMQVASLSMWLAAADRTIQNMSRGQTHDWVQAKTDWKWKEFQQRQLEAAIAALEPIPGVVQDD